MRASCLILGLRKVSAKNTRILAKNLYNFSPSNFRLVRSSCLRTHMHAYLYTHTNIHRHPIAFDSLSLLIHIVILLSLSSTVHYALLPVNLIQFWLDYCLSPIYASPTALLIFFFSQSIPNLSQYTHTHGSCTNISKAEGRYSLNIITGNFFTDSARIKQAKQWERSVFVIIIRI